jgi:hypothetical protein
LLLQGGSHVSDYITSGGSETVESGIKQVNKRMKGADLFWSADGAETILALRGQWLRQDGRWEHYWLCADQASKAA